jgi:hypothetical protein
VIYSITAGNGWQRWTEDRAGTLDFEPKLDPLTKKVCSRPIALASRWGTAWSSSARWMGAALPSIKTGKEKWQVS